MQIDIEAYFENENQINKIKNWLAEKIQSLEDIFAKAKKVNFYDRDIFQAFTRLRNEKWKDVKDRL